MCVTTASFSMTDTSFEASLLTYTRCGRARSSAARISTRSALASLDRSCQCRMESMLPRMLILLAALAAASPLDGLDQIYPQLDALYIDLHKNPELSLKEQRTSARMADELRKLGFEVTTGVGRTGVVGVLHNGKGPTVMLRTELDALPVEEKTGVPYASKVTTRNDAGETVSVMHACGHDIHMASWVGAATLLAHSKDRWHGTLVFVGQPAEEVVQGAQAMISDGLLTRFPRPDFTFAIHDTNLLPAGQIGVLAGP